MRSYSDPGPVTLGLWLALLFRSLRLLVAGQGGFYDDVVEGADASPHEEDRPGDGVGRGENSSKGDSQAAVDEMGAVGASPT